jgi:hypothetical protein
MYGVTRCPTKIRPGGPIRQRADATARRVTTIAGARAVSSPTVAADNAQLRRVNRAR